jgi:hypothetical protein
MSILAKPTGRRAAVRAHALAQTGALLGALMLVIPSGAAASSGSQASNPARGEPAPVTPAWGPAAESHPEAEPVPTTASARASDAAASRDGESTPTSEPPRGSLPGPPPSSRATAASSAESPAAGIEASHAQSKGNGSSPANTAAPASSDAALASSDAGSVSPSPATASRHEREATLEETLHQRSAKTVSAATQPAEKAEAPPAKSPLADELGALRAPGEGAYRFTATKHLAAITPAATEHQAAEVLHRELAATSSWPLVISSEPPNAASALGTRLQTLFARLESLARDNPARGALALPSNLATASTPELDSLSLGLAPHSAPYSEGASRPRGALAGSRRSPFGSSQRSPFARSPGSPSGTSRTRPVESGDALALGAGYGASAVPQRPTPEPVAALIYTRYHPAGRLRKQNSSGPGASVTTAATPIVSASLPGVGTAPIASGGAGAAAPATALMTLLATCLVPALLPGRLALNPFRWRSTLLARRLERPG